MVEEICYAVAGGVDLSGWGGEGHDSLIEGGWIDGWMDELWSALALSYLLMTTTYLVVGLGFLERVVEPFDLALLIGAFNCYRSIYLSIEEEGSFRSIQRDPIIIKFTWIE